MEKGVNHSVTGMKKREQIIHTNKMVFLWVAAAAVAVTIAIVLSQFLVRQFMFNGKIISALNTSNATLEQNIDKYDDLKREVVKLLANQRLNDLRINKDAGGDNALQVVIDAMPTSDDRLALAAALQQSILSRSGVQIDNLTFTDASAATDPAAGAVTTPATTAVRNDAVEVPFTFKAIGTYDQLKKMFADMQLSIRPISVTSVKLSGEGSAMNAEIQASTYYAVPKTTDLKKQEIKP